MCKRDVSTTFIPVRGEVSFFLFTVLLVCHKISKGRVTEYGPGDIKFIAKIKIRLE